jgi:hypothetical protein
VISPHSAETNPVLCVVLQADNLQPANRGVLWDQEIYDTFSYNQDRTFFHSFELESCAAGLLFVDEKEAKQFKKKVDEREKNASKSTKATMFGSGGRPPLGTGVNGKSHGLLGGIGNLLHGHRSSSAPSIPMPQPIVPSREAFSLAAPLPTESKTTSSARVDPSLLEELRQMGITEDQIEQNWDFIRTYIEQKRPQGQCSPTGCTAKCPTWKTKRNQPSKHRQHHCFEERASASSATISKKSS